MVHVTGTSARAATGQIQNGYREFPGRLSPVHAFWSFLQPPSPRMAPAPGQCCSYGGRCGVTYLDGDAAADAVVPTLAFPDSRLMNHTEHLHECSNTIILDRTFENVDACGLFILSATNRQNHKHELL